MDQHLRLSPRERYEMGYKLSPRERYEMGYKDGRAARVNLATFPHIFRRHVARHYAWRKGIPYSRGFLAGALANPNAAYKEPDV